MVIVVMMEPEVMMGRNRWVGETELCEDMNEDERETTTGP